MTEMKGEQPAPKAFWSLVHAQFPITQFLGIHNPGHDDHGEGRALDIGLNVKEPSENEIAWGLVNDVLLPNKAEIGWSYFIWDQWIWYPDKRGQVKGGFKGNHTDHIHVSWSRLTSQNTMFPDATAAMRELSRKLETTLEAIEAMKRLEGWWKVWDGNYYYYYFHPGGLVEYTKKAPFNIKKAPGPGQQMNNSGICTYTPPNQFVIAWKPVPGAEAACQETFYNASPGCKQMNATSNFYSPLVATRLS